MRRISAGKLRTCRLIPALTACRLVTGIGTGETQPNVRHFATTRWSVVLRCAGSAAGQEETEEALGQLCHTYWRPIFAFVCYRGYATADAQDLTQDFFVKVLEGSLLKLADPSRGRFRSLLLRSLQNFLMDASAKQQSEKRGGRVEFIQLDDWMAEAPSRLTISAGALAHWPPEKIFDVRWAATVVEQALRRLREECESRGRLRLFETVSGYLGADRAEVSYEQISKTLGAPVESVRRLLHALRARYRELLREEVAQTIADPAEIDDELRYLCGVLAAAE